MWPDVAGGRVMINPLTGEVLTPAQAANAAARFTEAEHTWADIVTFAHEARDRIEDQHERLVAIGLHTAQRVAAEMPPEVPEAAWTEWMSGFMVGLLATAADTAAKRAT